MSAKVPRCKRCGISYAAEQGCEVCEYPKKNMLWEETVGLEDVTQQAIRMLKANMDRLQKDMREMPADSPYREHHGTESCKLSRALSAVMKEARTIEKENRAAIKGLSIDERIALLEEFFETLPHEHQAQLITRFRKLISNSNYASRSHAHEL